MVWFSTTVFWALTIWAVALVALIGWGIWKIGERSIPALTVWPYRLASLGVGMLALLVAFPQRDPGVSLFWETRVAFPLLFTAALLGFYTWGLWRGAGLTFFLAFLATLFYRQPFTLVLEYVTLYVVWFFITYFVRNMGVRRALVVLFVFVSMIVAGVGVMLLSLIINTLSLGIDVAYWAQLVKTVLLDRLRWYALEIFLAGMVVHIGDLFLRRRLGPDYDQVLWRPILTRDPRLTTLFLFTAIPAGLLLWFVLSLFGIHTASDQAKDILQTRFEGFAQTAAHQTEFFFEFAHRRLRRWAEDKVWTTVSAGSASQAVDLLNDFMGEDVPFHELLLVDILESRMLVGVRRGGDTTTPSNLSLAEKRQIALFQQIQELDYLDLVETPRFQITRVTFFMRLKHRPNWLLVARTRIGESFYMKPVLKGLNDIAASAGGRGFLLTQQGDPLVLNAQDQEFVDLVRYYVLPSLSEEQLRGGLTYTQHVRLPNGQLYIAFYHPMRGISWIVLVLVPVVYLHNLAVQTGSALAWWSGIQLVLIFLFAFFVLRSVTAPLTELAREARRLAAGDLNHPLPQGGLAEVRELRESFETMRKSLKARLDELQRLLDVGRQLVASLDWSQVITPVLDAALYAPEARVARVALVPDFFPPGISSETQRFFGRGHVHGRFIVLDETLLQSLTEEDYRLVKLSQVWPSHLLAMPEDLGPDAHILLLPMWHQGEPIGTFYVVFTCLPERWEALLRYYRTLAEQLRLALSSARLYTQAVTERQRLEAVLWSTPDAIFMTDTNLQVVLANLSARELFGWPKQNDAYPLSFEQAFTMEELADMLLSTQHTAQSREMAFPDGRVYFVTVAPVRVRGRQMGQVGILRDITHFKRAESAKAEFVAAISHDLRSPLTLIRGYTSMLEMGGELTERQRRYIQQILMAVDNIAALVENLLELSRLDMGMELHPEWVPLRETIVQIVRSYELHARQKNIQISTEFHPDTPAFIEVDSSLFQRAIQNLVDNALKYTPEGGRVRIRVEPRGRDRVLLVVEDTGIGIAPAERERLFDRFFQAERARKMRAGGKGLGLAIVKSMVERHHGRIWVESEVGQGSRFYIELPIRQPREEENEGKPSQARKDGKTRKRKSLSPERKKDGKS